MTGLTFKENCLDLRNTCFIDIDVELRGYNCLIDVYDPWVSVLDAQSEYGIKSIDIAKASAYIAVVLAMAHREFKEMGAAIRELAKSNAVINDLKYVMSIGGSDLRL